MTVQSYLDNVSTLFAKRKALNFTTRNGVSLKPAFVNESTKKELEFLDGLQRSIEMEMREAIKQIENEDHQKIHVETSKAFTEFQSSKTFTEPSDLWKNFGTPPDRNSHVLERN
ncbi:hypothetical protein RB195_022955 [Necator americanus]|uniref:Uncharacterized protein n=1 Tax=Necator americanus TaxID=51031 RepID=A0ABR1EHA8_NECAM